jgi:CheY-like chemotaxis protein
LDLRWKRSGDGASFYEMNRNLTILIAEDDPNDVILLERALRRNGINNPIQVSRDGEAALSYLQGLGEYANREKHPVPSVLFLDIKMPKKSGLEVLKWLHEHQECKVVPKIVLTSSRQESDVEEAYGLGAHSYIVKPVSFENLVQMIKTAFDYWSWCEKPKGQPK